MTFHFRPAKRLNTPLVIGIAGPTKSGKTYSAHRLARGLAQGGPVVMINAEGAKGHQYADTFEYIATDIEPPYRPERYTEALKAALALDPKPAVVIIDSMSHMHDGPGGLLDFHESELDRLAGSDYGKRQRMTWTAWIEPKRQENEFIYAVIDSPCHVVLCFRAKPKLKLVRGKEPIDLGLQPISSDRVSFETLFTLMLPAHSKGFPDLALSEMREPFDTIVPAAQQISEETGRKLAAWTTGAGSPEAGGEASQEAADPSAAFASRAQAVRLFAIANECGVEKERLKEILVELTGQASTSAIPLPLYEAIVAAVEFEARLAASVASREETQ